MHHVIVRHVALAVCGVLTAAALLFGWVTSGRPGAAAPAEHAAPPEGSALFYARCGHCHTAAGLAAAMRPAGRPPRDWMAFLEQHGQASAAENRLIHAYLTQGAVDAGRGDGRRP